VQYFVTPSSVWPADAEEKERITEGYRAKLGQIDCKWFDQGEGSCPFGTSCFYRCGRSRAPLLAPVCLLSDALWLPHPCMERHLSVLDDRISSLKQATTGLVIPVYVASHQGAVQPSPAIPAGTYTQMAGNGSPRCASCMAPAMTMCRKSRSCSPCASATSWARHQPRVRLAGQAPAALELCLCSDSSKACAVCLC